MTWYSCGEEYLTITHNRWWRLGGVLLVWLAMGSAALQAEQGPGATQETDMSAAIGDNMTVRMEYTLTADGKVVDSTEGREPFQYVHGQGQVIPGLERQLAGLHAGDAREISVEADDAYGPLDPTAFVEVARDELPPDVKPEVGLTLRGMDPDGKAFRATITGVRDDSVTMDLNHPLAGKTLLFKVKILEISPTA